MGKKQSIARVLYPRNNSELNLCIKIMFHESSIFIRKDGTIRLANFSHFEPYWKEL